MSSGITVIQGAAVLDAVRKEPLRGKVILIEGKRIKAIAGKSEVAIPADAKVIDATGKYVIPGMMNANVHLFMALTMERLSRHFGCYEDIIAEAAQIALKAGLTTVFDTWGPRRHLIEVRDKINTGQVVGSRIFCAGNIVGFDGPLSPDFLVKGADGASHSFANRINSIWVENVGRHLMWLTADEVGGELRGYIERGINFVKYASNEHGVQAAGAFLQFSPRVQSVIVEEAHRAGLTAQAHCMSVEGLRCALEAGCDLITHCNITGPRPIPPDTLEFFVKNKVGAVVFPFTQRRLDWFFKDLPNAGGPLRADLLHTIYRAADINVRNLIHAGATILMANDAGVFPPEYESDPQCQPWLGLDMDNYLELSQGHFFWFKAMEEKGCPPFEMLQAATKNIAEAYRVDADLGTVQVGKVADLVLLDEDPMIAAGNYRKIYMIIKDGMAVDREALPLKRILTAAQQPPEPEEARYVPFASVGGMPKVPSCRACMSTARF